MAWGRDAQDSASNALPDRREFNVTLDCRFESGLLRGLWLRARASNLHVDGAARDSNNIRVILNYDIPVL